MLKHHLEKVMQAWKKNKQTNKQKTTTSLKETGSRLNR